MTEITERQRNIMRHALGADHETNPGYRNRYAIELPQTWLDVLGLVEAGLMVQGERKGVMTFFHVTADGQELIGCKEAR